MARYAPSWEWEGYLNKSLHKWGLETCLIDIVCLSGDCRLHMVNDGLCNGIIV